MGAVLFIISSFLAAIFGLFLQVVKYGWGLVVLLNKS
jgi:hypothetical protein